MTFPSPADLQRQQRELDAHLAECAECWERLRWFEKQDGIDLHLPPNPTVSTERAKALHSGDETPR